MTIKIRYSILFFNFFPPFLPQFLNSPKQQIEQADGDHGKPDICPTEKVSANNGKAVFWIPPELRFKEHFQCHEPPAEKEKYSPRYKGIMSAFAMSEKLRIVVMQ